MIILFENTHIVVWGAITCSGSGEEQSEWTSELGEGGGVIFCCSDFGFLPRFLKAGSPLWILSILRLRELFHLFFTLLSVLPSMYDAITVHWLPNWLWSSISLWSSSSVHDDLATSGLRWFVQRSLHCFPIRPGRLSASLTQFFGPLFFTNSTIISSSSRVHDPLTRLGLRTFSQRPAICCAVFPGKWCKSEHHDGTGVVFMILDKCWSSSGVQMMLCVWLRDLVGASGAEVIEEMRYVYKWNASEIETHLAVSQLSIVSINFNDVNSVKKFIVSCVEVQ